LPAYKEKNGTWTSKFKYKDWLGEWKQKTKRGFERKKDALEFEADYKARFIQSADIAFSALADNYMKDLVDNRKIDITTAAKKERIFATMIIPFFGRQSWIQKKGYEKYPDTGYAPTYLKIIHAELSAILNYAVRYYRLPYNPCSKAGSMGKGRADAMQIWTLDQFESFIAQADKTGARVAFDILFWTGIREGELLALTPSDFSPELRLTINKSFVVIDGEQVIKDPKNETSNRCIAIPQFLYDEVQEYIAGLYGMEPTDRLFMFTKSFLLKEIKRMSQKAGLTPIRVHDLRHSHASLLIEMGFNILMISERLGHKNVQTTWNTYAHLYPDKGRQIAFGLQEAKTTGITANQTAEDQVIGLLGEIQKMLPNYNSYESDDIILWDSVNRQKTIVSRQEFDTITGRTTEPAKAFLIMIQDGYYKADSQHIFCFSSRGMPVEFL